MPALWQPVRGRVHAIIKVENNNQFTMPNAQTVRCDWIYFVKPSSVSKCTAFKRVVDTLKDKELKWGVKLVPAIYIRDTRGGLAGISYYAGMLYETDAIACDKLTQDYGERIDEANDILAQHFNTIENCIGCFTADDLLLTYIDTVDTPEHKAWKLEVEKAYKKVVKKYKTNPMEKQIISLDIVRENGKSYMKFSVPKLITEIYEAQAKEIKKSEVWKGLDFFYIPELLNNERYQAMLRSNKLFDKYGSSFIDNGYMNIAWLRTKQGEGQFQIPDSVSFAELTSLGKSVHQFIKDYFDEYMRDFKLGVKMEVVF